jgi:hypothetical protein
MLRSWFLSHPDKVGETYLEHMQVAGSFGFQLVGAGLACLVHAIIPRLFERTGSTTIASLHQRLVVGRSASNNRTRAA